MADDRDWGECTCGGKIVPKDDHWAMCTECGDDSFPLTYDAAYGGGENLDLEPNAAEKALTIIAELCGIKNGWDFPGQVVGYVRQLKETATSVEDRNQRLLAAIAEAIERTEDNGPGAKSILQAAVKRDLPYEPDKGRTHYEGCWRSRGHHNCAVRYIDELGASINKSQAEIQRIRKRHGLKGGEPLLGLNLPEGDEET